MKKVLPKKIGNFRILEQLGEGGMGIVYLAEQPEPVRRRVALKVIKLGMDTAEVVARFEAEQQALAMMNHSSIAKVLGAGATDDGRPYFVMEPVMGIPITEYCDKYRLGIRARLNLFIQTCNAIHHAHQKGIIHRDIKPSNVMVTEEEGSALPKVIDFGVAKAINQRLTEKTLYTQSGTLVGTPEYMSPEQAESGGLDVDTGTDVYSLGVLLYELLVGAVPLNLSGLAFARMQKAIAEENPPKLATRLTSLGDEATDIAMRRQTDRSSLLKQLGGELNWITLKAIEKDRTRRYASASELAADVTRHLQGAAVLARPASLAYLLQKAVTRYKAPMAAAAALLILLIGFALAMAIQADRIAAEAERANLAAETARQVSAFMEDLFVVSDPNEALGNTITAREILDKGAQKIETELADQPIVQARLMHSIGRVYKGLGLYGPAASLLEQAVETRERVLGEEHPDVVDPLNTLGDVYRMQGRYIESEQLLRHALAIGEVALGPNHPHEADSLNNLAIVYANMGRFAEAESVLRRSLVIKEKLLEPNHPDLAGSLNNLAMLYGILGRYADAERMHLRALRIQEHVLGPNHPDLASGLTNLGNVYAELGRYAEAESLYERATAIRVEALAPDHPHVAWSLHGLANLYRNQNRLDEAEPLYAEALSLRVRAGEKANEAWTLNDLAKLYAMQGKKFEAEETYRRALLLRENILGTDHPDVAKTLDDYAALLRELHRDEEADPLEARSLAIQNNNNP